MPTSTKLAAKLDGIAREVNEGASDRVIDVLGEGNPDKTSPKSLFRPVRVKFEDREYTPPPGLRTSLPSSTATGARRRESDRAVHVMEAYRL